MLVLCVDNDDRILNGMNALLSGWGCEPVMAKTAREAARTLQAARRIPDFMLVDYHLDHGDGLAVIGEIRAKLDADIPAVLITADRSPELRELAQKAGIRVLHKPMKPAALRAWMTQWGASRAAAE
jgi:CheY-like chemotaxis protein